MKPQTRWRPCAKSSCSPSPFDEVLNRLADLTMRTILDADGITLTVVTADGVCTAAATEDRHIEADQADCTAVSLFRA